MILNSELKLGFIFSTATVPSLILLLAQFIYVRSNSSALSTEIAFGSFANLSEKQVFFSTISTVLPAFLLFNRNKVRENSILQIAGLAFLFGWAQMYFLTNGESGDFSWGYDLAVGLFVPVSLCTIDLTDASHASRIRSGMALALYCYQTFVGFVYLLICMNTHEFCF